MKTKKTKLEWQCCFCGETVKKTSTDPVEISISLPDGEAEGLGAHGKCLKEHMKLHPSMTLDILDE